MPISCLSTNSTDIIASIMSPLYTKVTRTRDDGNARYRQDLSTVVLYLCLPDLSYSSYLHGLLLDVSEIRLDLGHVGLSPLLLTIRSRN